MKQAARRHYCQWQRQQATACQWQLRQTVHAIIKKKHSSHPLVTHKPRLISLEFRVPSYLNWLFPIFRTNDPLILELERDQYAYRFTKLSTSPPTAAACDE